MEDLPGWLGLACHCSTLKWAVSVKMFMMVHFYGPEPLKKLIKRTSFFRKPHYFNSTAVFKL
jgi:hypothetical protein